MFVSDQLSLCYFMVYGIELSRVNTIIEICHDYLPFLGGANSAFYCKHVPLHAC